jgi:hypothetical protein
MTIRDDLAAARQEIADLQATFTARVDARVALVLKARSLAGAMDCAGMTDAEVMAHAVAVSMGATAIQGRDADYIEARFDHLVETRAQADPVRLALADRRH